MFGRRNLKVLNIKEIVMCFAFNTILDVNQVSSMNLLYRPLNLGGIFGGRGTLRT